MPRWLLLVLPFVAAMTSPALAAVTISGTVFVDSDGDGVFSSGDSPVPGAVVAFEKTGFARADGSGRYSLSVPADGILWVRTPDGFSPAPVWRTIAVRDGDRTIDLPLTRRAVNGPVSFIHASDTHIGLEGIDLVGTTAALRQAAATEPAPHFLVITGDITQANDPAQFDVMLRALDGLGVPFVPVPGNHDWYDGGAAYRKYLGPPSYSFDAGGVHFVVLEGGPDETLPFLDKDLAFSPTGTPIAVFFHFPPVLPSDAPFIDGLRARGVRWMFTGHLHQNRVLKERDLLDYNLQPMIMGGMDLAPAGYRVVTIEGDNVRMSPHTTVEKPVFRVLSPLAGACLPPGAVPVIAAVEAGEVPVTVTARLDGAPALPLSARGGWDYAATLDVPSEGEHMLTVELDRPGASAQQIDARFCTQAMAAPSNPLTDWPQLQGGPTHTGATPDEVAPPLAPLWTATVGGNVRGGSPVLAGGRLFVPVIDLGDGSRGGVVALDALTGRTLWEHRAGQSVNNAPAVSGHVVIIGLANGEVEALDDATGTLRWRYDLAQGLSEGASNLYAAPTVDDGVVYIGVVRNLAALDVATGTVLWERSPENYNLDSTYAALSVADGLVVGLFGRGYSGIAAFDATTGNDVWRAPADLSVGTSATPLIAGENVYSGNSATVVYRLDLLSGRVDWNHQIEPSGTIWDYGIAASPAYSGGRLFVPTLHGGLSALHDNSGAPMWNVSVTESVLHPAHYRRVVKAVSAAPVVTGGIVWVGGADGILRAVDTNYGEVLWTQDLGAPIMSGPVPASPLLFVATWDGSVRALAHLPGTQITPPHHGCAVGGEGSSTLLVLALLLGALRLRGRRPRG
jgi:outer membrane protein assembly factor BamB